MKVLDLQCSQGHAFEGWFASEEDFQAQLGRGLVACPLCGDKALAKLPSAPRLNLRAGEAPARPAVRASAPPDPARPGTEAVAALPQQALQAAWMQMVRRVLAQTEDVGERFAEEARRIHYDEAEGRGIRGQATRAQTEELQEEGIAVMPLPLPEGMEGPLQ